MWLPFLCYTKALLHIYVQKAGVIMERATDSKALPAVIKGVLFASIASILLIVLISVGVWKKVLNEKGVYITIPIIKALCAAIAAYTVMRTSCPKKVLFAGVAGLSYIVFAFVIYCVMSKQISIQASFLVDMLIGTSAATITALVTDLLTSGN